MFHTILVLAVCTVSSIFGASWDINKYSIQYQQTAVMECQVDLATFEGFYYNGTLIEEVADRILFVEEPNLKILEIFKINETDYGTYICKDGGGSSEATLEIAVTVPILSPMQKLAIGFEGVVEAEVFANPRGAITWYIQRVGEEKKLLATLDKSGVMTSGAADYSISPRGALTINSVKEGQSGTFIITAKGTGTRVSKTTVVQVGNRPILKATPEKTYTTTSGLDLKLPCEWSEMETGPSWTFTKTNVSETDITAGFDATGLTLEKVTPANEGLYKCHASNEYGSSMASTELTLVIIATTIETDRSIKIASNKSYTLSCEATGTPTPALVMLKKKSDGTQETKVTGKGSLELNFEPVKVSDKGEYSCVADNGAKDATGELLVVKQVIMVDVLTPPVIVPGKTTKEITSAEGLKFSAMCSAQGNPSPNVTLKMNEKVYGENFGIATDGVVQAKYDITAAKIEDFGTLVCTAVNTQGTIEHKINVLRVVKAKAPVGLRLLRDVPGLEYIDLTWNVSVGADSYIVYINDTRQEPIVATQITIDGLTRSTYYSFKVAPVNLAGNGNASKAVIFKTSDITIPGPVSTFNKKDVTSVSATITWNAPANTANPDLLTYRVKYCTNATVPVCQVRNEKKDNSVDLDRLERGTTYKITVVAINQGVEGKAASFQITTKNTTPAPPSKSGKATGLSTGAVAGIIIAVILIILIVIDLFCCFFNNCGFSHCCFETFCATKGKKYTPADTTEEEELKPKKQEETV